MAVNVGGTKNLIDACIETGVSTIVYTRCTLPSSYIAFWQHLPRTTMMYDLHSPPLSTTNVVFSGNELPNKDETQPYIPLDRHVDYYSRTKSIAEQVRFLLCACACVMVRGRGRLVPHLVFIGGRRFWPQVERL